MRPALAYCAVALLAAVVVTGTGQAADQGVELAESVPMAAPVDPKLSPRLAEASGPVGVFVELAATPAVDAHRSGTAARAARSIAHQKADGVLANLRARDRSARELFRTNNALSGVAVAAEAAKLRELSAHPDVVSIKPLTPKKIANSSAAQLTRALQTWRHNGMLGTDVRIGVVDTGIDYMHADFGGPGTRFPSAKVVGGTDFVGDAYDASNPDNATPVPDHDPIDCNGHGTHVAGTAAGFGVTADGRTFSGDYARLTGEQLNTMHVGPGVAPKALLYALKVFGCNGSTDVVAQALDWAVDPNQDGNFEDHLDVINLSLGSEYGAPDDPESAFVRKLTEAGVLVVASAGNGGDLYDVGGSPGNAPAALTVASTRDSFVLRDAAEVTAPANLAGAKSGQYSANYTGYDSLNVTRAAVKLSDAGNVDGCQPFSDADKAAVRGRFAWLEWDDNDTARRCGSAARTDNAQTAGAVGVLLSSTLEHFTAGIAGNAGIPVFQFTRSATDQLRPALDAGTLTVRLGSALRSSMQSFDESIVDTASSFTSRGVRSSVKPDVAAPGDTIASARSGSGSGVSVHSGTSMAAPHVTGIAALLRQAHPDWSPAEIKAAVVNTAGRDVRAEHLVHAPNRVGAGRVDTKSALDNNLLALDEEEPDAVSVGFGVVEAGRRVSVHKRIKVVNKGAREASYTVDYEPITSVPGVRYELDRTSLEVAPHGSATVKITLTVDDPTQLRKSADPTVAKLHPLSGRDLPRQFLADVSGRVVFTPIFDGGVTVRLPVYAAPKPVADVDAPRHVWAPRNGPGALTLSGRGLDQGTGDERYRSLVSALELQAKSPRLPPCSRRKTTDCAVNDTARGGDLRFVGVASTAALAKRHGRPATAMLSFGIATWEDWYNIGTNTQPIVDIDVNSDGSPDYEVRVSRPADTDLLLAVTTNAVTRATVDVQPVNGLFGDVDANVFDTNVIVLPVRLDKLGIDAATESTHRLSYTVRVVGFYGGSDGLIDAVSQPLTFDPLRPGLWVQGSGEPALLHHAKPGTALLVHRDPAALARDDADSLLLLHHHNGSGDRTSVVRVMGVPGFLT